MPKFLVDQVNWFWGQTYLCYFRKYVWLLPVHCCWEIIFATDWPTTVLQSIACRTAHLNFVVCPQFCEVNSKTKEWNILIPSHSVTSSLSAFFCLRCGCGGGRVDERSHHSYVNSCFRTSFRKIGAWRHSSLSKTAVRVNIIYIKILSAQMIVKRKLSLHIKHCIQVVWCNLLVEGFY